MGAAQEDTQADQLQVMCASTDGRLAVRNYAPIGPWITLEPGQTGFRPHYFRDVTLQDDEMMLRWVPIWRPYTMSECLKEAFRLFRIRLFGEEDDE